MLLLPENLRQVAAWPGGQTWLNRLPKTVERLLSKWDLDLQGEPFPGSNVSLVMPVSKSGEKAVLKVQFPDIESRYEAEALDLWKGRGAVKLIAQDTEYAALLLEFCQPGAYLADARDVDRLGIVMNLLPRLWCEADGPFLPLGKQAEIWARDIPTQWSAAGQSCEKRLVEAALDYLKILVQDPPETVLLHQDLHGHNIISARREPWLVIDPKPLIGEKAFSLAPVVRSFEFGAEKKDLLYRLDRLSRDLAVDRQRALGWTVVQTMAWSFSSPYSERHFQTVRWLLDN